MTPRTIKSLTAHLTQVCGFALAAVTWSATAAALDLPSLSLDGSYYGGVGFASTGLDPSVSDSGFSVTDNADSGVQLFVGRDVSPRISLEGYYASLGNAGINNVATGVDGQISYSTVGASGLVYLLGSNGRKSLARRTGFNVYGRLGVGRLINNGLGIEFNRESSWHLASGLGASYNLRNGFGLRAEFQNFDSDARSVSFNIVKRFQVKKSGNRFPVFADHDENFLLDDSVGPIEVKASLKMEDRDTDADGVNDRDDECNSTREGVSVDASGCDFTGVLDGVSFASASADLTGAGKKALDTVVASLKENPQVRISVQAHTDNRGSAAANMALSRNRAESVVRYLIGAGKIDLGRISAVGFGESKPVRSNRTEEGRVANRRVEIKVAR